MAADSAGSTEWTYTITRDNASASTLHASATLADAGGAGAKIWNFLTAATISQAWQFGLVSEFIQKASSSGTVNTDDTYAWSQDPAGNPFISTKVSVTDPGAANQLTAKTTQVLDQYGNTTQTAIYPYNDTTTPLRTYNNTFLNSGTYPQHYILDRLLTTQLMTGGILKTLVTNTYDGYYAVDADCGSYCSPNELNPHPPIAPNQRGYLAYSVTPAVSTSYGYQYGKLNRVTGSDGTSLQALPAPSTNYAAPGTILTQSYGETIGYNSWLGVTQTTGLNGEQLYLTYDWIGRPATATSPYGAVTTYSYATSLPSWQTKSGPDGFTRTTLDGLGRAIRVERGSDSAHIQSVVDTVYAPCACSPLGKVQKVSAPYQPGAATVNWTVYTYDGIGRTLSVTKPDGASTTTYAYAGNQTTVTDPAGKWKTFTTDVQGNLTTVTEPDPANPPGGTLTTTYTYDWMNHLTGVSMPRGSTTQTRTFVYNDAGLLISATNPENGTVTYTYNGDNTLYYKRDANGQDSVYTYDAQKRVTRVQRYPGGKASWEDSNQRVTYTYDTNTLYPDFSHYSQGRLTMAQYTVFDGTVATPVTEIYSYHPAGAVTAKQLRAIGCGTSGDGSDGCSEGFMGVDYTYNGAGQVASYTISRSVPDPSPDSPPSGPTFTYAYDSMGRPATLTDNLYAMSQGGTPNTVWARNAQYDFAGRMASLQTYIGTYYGTARYATETDTWNVNGQMTAQNWDSLSGGVQYIYPATQNNGQITQAVDTISGETTSYQYDALKRLTSAASVPNAGSAPAAWTQALQYDGFGNLTAKVLNGTATPIAVNGATNRLSGATYYLNGNMASGLGMTLSYDVANRLQTSTPISGGTEYYAYAPDNKRIFKRTPNGYDGRKEWTFYGAHGEKLGVFTLFGGPYTTAFIVVSWNVSFAGRLITENWNPYTGTGTYLVGTDRLGTNRAGGRYYPYGEEIGTTPNDRTKFTTYTRDGFTGLDYADQRFYASSYGRFNTPDPYSESAGPRDPVSWNRYSYVAGDPINRNDRSGLVSSESPCGDFYCMDDGTASAWSGNWWGANGTIGGGIDPCSRLILAFDGPPGNVNCFTAPVISVSAPSKPPEPECFAQLKDRPVNDPTASKVDAVHTFWWVQGYIDGTSVQFILSAGPNKVVDSKGKTTTYLDAWAVAGSANGADNSGQHLDWSSGLSSGLCDQVDRMIIAAERFSQDSIIYNPIAAFGFGGPNSNSVAHYFGIAGDFNPTPPATAYGWYSPL